MLGRGVLIEELEPILEDYADYLGEPLSEILSERAYAYWSKILKEQQEKPEFTDNGRKVFTYMKENYRKCYNSFIAKTIGEDLNISSRTAAGAMKSLIVNGYVEKIGENPVIYSLTDKGLNTSL